MGKSKINHNKRYSLILSILHSLNRILKESFPRKVALLINRKDNPAMIIINKTKINHIIKMKIPANIEEEVEVEEEELKDSNIRKTTKRAKVIRVTKEAEVAEAVEEVKVINIRMMLSISKKEKQKESNFKEMINLLDKFLLQTKKKLGVVRWIIAKVKLIIQRIWDPLPSFL